MRSWWDVNTWKEPWIRAQGWWHLWHCCPWASLPGFGAELGSVGWHRRAAGCSRAGLKLKAEPATNLAGFCSSSWWDAVAEGQERSAQVSGSLQTPQGSEHHQSKESHQSLSNFALLRMGLLFLADVSPCSSSLLSPLPLLSPQHSHPRASLSPTAPPSASP